MERIPTIDDLEDSDGLYRDKDDNDDDNDGEGGDGGGDGNDANEDSGFVPVDESGDNGESVKETVPVVLPAKRGAAKRKADGEQKLAVLLAELKDLDKKLAKDGGEVDQRDRGLTLSPGELRRDLPLTIRSLRVLRKEREELDAKRPRTRADCEDGPRPCVYVSCGWHPYLDVNPETGAIKLNFPHLEVHELPTTCILDEIEAAEGDGLSLERVGEIMNLTRERVRQREVRALIKVQAAERAEEAAAEEVAADMTAGSNGHGNGVSETPNEVQSGGDSAADLDVDFTPLKLD